MKNKILITICLLVFLGYNSSSRDAEKTASDKETVNVSCTPEVQKLAQTFIDEYAKRNNSLDFRLEPVSFSGFADAVNGKNRIGFIDGDTKNLPANYFKMLVARHIIVPVTNNENPGLKELEKQGISSDKMMELKAVQRLHLYVPGDGWGATCVTEFLNKSAADFSATPVKSKEEMVRKLQKDKTAIAFCSLSDILNAENDFAKNVKILPVDKNGNGRIDYFEEVYRELKNGESVAMLSLHEKNFGSLDDFKRGVWIGKYPRSLVNEVNVVAATLPKDKNITDFLAWAVTDAQQLVKPAGFNELVYNERQSKLDALTPPVTIASTAQPGLSNSKIILLLIIAFLLVTVPFGLVVKLKDRKAKKPAISGSGKTGILNENTVEIPNGLYFDKTHTWSFREKDGSVKVGVDDFLQHVTGKFTSIKMKSPGEQITKNEPLVILTQKGKQIEIYAPVSGKIKEINEEVVTDPSVINESPYSEGWIYTIEPANWQREMGFMKTAEVYKEWLKNEFTRLRDFLAEAVNNHASEKVAYQEGGELTTNVLQNFGPRIWEDFQKNFIENSDLNS